MPGDASARRRQPMNSAKLAEAKQKNTASPRPRKKAEANGEDKAQNGSRLAPVRDVNYDFLIKHAGFWLRRAQLTVMKSFEQHLGELKLRPVEAAALVLIGKNRGLSQSSLTAALGTDQSSMVGISTRLEERGLIERRRLMPDRRFQILDLTKDGELAVVAVKEGLSVHNKNVLRNLSPAERDLLIQLLKKITV